MNARQTTTRRTSLRTAGLRVIALIVSLGVITFASAQPSVVFSQTLYATEDDRAPNLYVGPSFGAAVAISGATAVVGMPAYNEEVGRVGVYTRVDEGWLRTATISSPAPDRPESFGRALDLEGRVLVVDAHSAAYLFRKNGDHWRVVGAFGQSDPVTTLGSTIAYSKGFMARGTHSFRINEDGSRTELPGVVRVYEHCGRDIRRAATLRASDAMPADRFGVSLAMHRDVLVVGAPGLGAAYVFVRDGGRWVERQKLVSSDGGAGGFGASVAISNGMILVGAPGLDVPNADPMSTPEGKAYAFLSYRGSWFESQRLNDDGRFYLQFGAEVALSRRVAAVTSPIDVAASWSSSKVIAFDRVGAELTSPIEATSTGSDGARVVDIDASRRRIIAGVLESPIWGGPWSGRVLIIELSDQGAFADTAGS